MIPSSPPIPHGGKPPWRRIALAIALCLTLARSALAGQVALPAMLSDFNNMPANYAVVGNEKFSNFSFTAFTTGGAPTPDPSLIHISAINNSDIGLFFQGGPFLTMNGQTLDAHLSFDVTALDPMKQITTAELKITAATIGGGYVAILENVDDPSNVQLGQLATVESQSLPGGGQNFGKISFAAQTSIHIDKDIFLMGNASGSTAPINLAQLSDFSQMFDPQPVPEPSSIAMAVMGGGGLACFAWRRRKQRSRRTAKESAT